MTYTWINYYFCPGAADRTYLFLHAAANYQLNVVADFNNAVYSVERNAAYERIIIIAFLTSNIFGNQILKGIIHSVYTSSLFINLSAWPYQ